MDILLIGFYIYLVVLSICVAYAIIGINKQTSKLNQFLRYGMFIYPEEELTKATKTISEYCVTRSHKNPCRFNQSGKKNECDCILLKKPPEGWSDANNKN